MRTHALLLTALAIAAATHAPAQTPPDHPLERGFHADSSFQIADVDHIDLSRGALELVIPIGPRYLVGGNLSYQLKLAYHSDVWDVVKEDACPLGPEPCWHVVTTPNGLSNAGLGFMFHLGTLRAGSNPTSPIGWRFVDTSGAEHMFHETLHDGETAQSGFGYTRDASYLRWAVADPYRTVESPDGTKYWFVEYDTEAHKWRLVKIGDTFGNFVLIDYDVTAAGEPRWTITDSTWRMHTVLFDAAHRHLTKVTLAAFNGTTAQYTFSYSWPQVHRSCLHTEDNYSEYLNVPEVTPGAANTVPFLKEIARPDGSTYAMLEGSTPAYYTCCLGCVWTEPPHLCGAGTDGGTVAPGVIKRLTLPTGGGIAWSFADNSYSWEEATRCTGDVICARPGLLVWSGVQQRSLLDPSGVSLGTWTYTHRTTAGYGPSSDCPSKAENPGSRPEERTMVVKAPDGNATVHYFRAYPGSNPYMDHTHRRDFGLPYTRRVNDAACVEPACDPDPHPKCEGRFLSVQHFSGDVAVDDDGDTCEPEDRVWDEPNDKWNCVDSKTAIRTVFRQFALDVTATAEGYRHANRNLISERTVYEDGTEAVTDYSGDTGLGRFRTVATSGTFGAANARTTFTNYTPASGTYPNSFVVPSTSLPWLLNTYSETASTEVIGEAGKRAKSEACFEPATGFLRGTRALKDTGTGGTYPVITDPTRNEFDVVVRYSHDGLGNVTEEQYFGGDTASVGTSELCGLLTGVSSSSASYRIEHTYQYGSRRTSRYLDSSGAPVSFYSLDLDIDLNTGLPAASYERSTGNKGETGYQAGIKTSYVYDALGRLTDERPEATTGLAWRHYQHIRPGQCGLSTAKVETCARPNGTTTACADVDTTGCPGNTGLLTRAAYTYDGQGRLVGEYTLQPAGSWNKRLTEYDALGRKTSASEWVANGTPVGPGNQTRFSAFDPFGRPGTITAADGSSTTLTYQGVRQVARTVSVSGASATTTEEYDRQGRLWKVTEPSGTGGTNVTTTYGYDVGGQLAKASTTSGATTQTRTFTFDNRGFLTSETLPEIGAAGGGSTLYRKIDARGHVGLRNDGLHWVKFEFDRAERPIRTWESNDAWGSVRLLREFTYGADNVAGDLRNGALIQS
ncbi:MAG: hypothetical protein AB1625_09400, partial [Acidobacteriota bacterium]